ncbi:MAG: reverse transcriptase domain-containing protein, partial [Pseudomonadota bacterium]|nr:reverse transcriptase domain-containing protein [Pseudomonadota bacterium]
FSVDIVSNSSSRSNLPKCFNSNVLSEIVVKLSLHCLNNNIINFRNFYYKQNKGIVTGDNNSVSLANIAMHFIVKQIKEIEQSKLFKRYIDDMIYITTSKAAAENIKVSLRNHFGRFDLELEFDTMSTENKNQEIAFLDVLHQTNLDATKGFIIRDYVKPTAKRRSFLNGRSYHPSHVFKSIIVGEAKRLRRLNEEEKHYQTSIDRLQKKCELSNFNKNITKDMIKHVRQFTKTGNKTLAKEKRTRLVWASQFKAEMKINKTEEQLVPFASLVYSKPPTIRNLLFRYSNQQLSADQSEEITSRKCHKCSLCGNHGRSKNMVLEKTTVTDRRNNRVPLQKNLTCSDYGIYAAECSICKNLYVGQTKNKFSTRWNNHRNSWKNQRLGNKKVKDENDNAALYKHYTKHHPEIDIAKLELADAYGVLFIEQPKNKRNLDLKESFWIAKLN